MSYAHIEQSATNRRRRHLSLWQYQRANIVKTLYIDPGSPWEKGCCESFNSKLRDEFLALEILYQ